MIKNGKMIIMTGVTGSGKSFLAKQLQRELAGILGGDYDVELYSTDDYWLRPDGIYDWNFRYIGEAHKWNQERTARYFDYDDWYYPPCAIIDNTNLTTKELKPYLDIAKKYKLEVEVQEANTPWRLDADELFKRNTHKVPLDNIINMLKKKVPLEELQQYVKEFMEV